MRLILCFLMIVTVPVTAHAGDFWKDVEALYKEVRGIDSRLQDGMAQKEFIDKYNDWKASYNDFMDTHGEKTCAKQTKKGEPTDESNVCMKFTTVLYAYNLADATLGTIKLLNELESVGGGYQYSKIKDSEDKFKDATGRASDSLKEVKVILNNHR